MPWSILMLRNLLQLPAAKWSGLQQRTRKPLSDLCLWLSTCTTCPHKTVGIVKPASGASSSPATSPASPAGCDEVPFFEEEREEELDDELLEEELGGRGGRAGR